VLIVGAAFVLGMINRVAVGEIADVSEGTATTLSTSMRCNNSRME
jgi:hypothetical protein